MNSTDLTILNILGAIVPLAAVLTPVALAAYGLICWARSMQPASAAKWTRHMDNSPLLDAPITDAPGAVEPRPWKPLSKPVTDDIQSQQVTIGTPPAPMSGEVRWICTECWQWDAAAGYVLEKVNYTRCGNTTAPGMPQRRDTAAITATTPLSAGSN